MTHNRATSMARWPAQASLPFFGRRRRPQRELWATGSARCGTGRSLAPDRIAIDLRSRIARRLLAPALSSPSAAWSLERCPAPSCNTVPLRPQVARGPRDCRSHARWPLGPHAPRAGAPASPHAADGRSVSALKRHSSQAPGTRKVSLEAKASRHRGLVSNSIRGAC